MSDDLERRIHDAFHGGSLPPAPDSLAEALERVPDAPVRSRRSTSGRSLFGLLVAAALMATLGALAVTGGAPGPGPTAPAVVPSPTPAEELRLEYQLLPTDGFTPGGSDLATTISILEARLAATGVVGATVKAEGTDRIIVTLPGVTDPAPIRKLIGQAGRVDFVPLGLTQFPKGQTISLVQFPPMFSGDQVASATVGADQNGRPAIVFVLKPEAARLFGDYTARNIGSYFAVTVDGVVVSVPDIRNAILHGSVGISGGGVDGFDATDVATIVAFIDSGALPFPIHEVGP